ncbi:hypothetical protein Hanom_Chr05g00396231 [Helianthus anomalus]
MKVKNSSEPVPRTPKVGTELFGSLLVQEGKNRHQHGTENAKSRYRIEFENLLVREIRY